MGLQSRASAGVWSLSGSHCRGHNRNSYRRQAVLAVHCCRSQLNESLYTKLDSTRVSVLAWIFRRSLWETRCRWRRVSRRWRYPAERSLSPIRARLQTSTILNSNALYIFYCILIYLFILKLFQAYRSNNRQHRDQIIRVSIESAYLIAALCY